MAKSIRSKTKRFYRAKKREDSVYAAVHAARLNRLHRKLKEITLTDKEGDVDVEEVSQFSDDEGTKMQGRCPRPFALSYTVFGLLNPEDLMVESVYYGNRGASKAVDASDIFPHLFPACTGKDNED